jgi:hypothetical protein
VGTPSAGIGFARLGPKAVVQSCTGCALHNCFTRTLAEISYWPLKQCETEQLPGCWSCSPDRLQPTARPFLEFSNGILCFFRRVLGRASKRMPRASSTFNTVPNSGFTAVLNVRYKFSLLSPVALAMFAIPRIRATVPIARAIYCGSPVARASPR